MQLKDFCINTLPEVFRSDPWTQAIFTGASVANESNIESIRDIYNWDDFLKMSVDRLQWYENKLGILYGMSKDSMTLAKRRSIVMAWWGGWNKPSVQSVKNILDAVGVSYTNIQYRHRHGTVYVALGEDAPEDLLNMAKDIIRRHLPAHINILYNQQPPVSHYLTCAEIHAMQTKDLFGNTCLSKDTVDGSTVYLNDYYFKHEEE